MNILKIILFIIVIFLLRLIVVIFDDIKYKIKSERRSNSIQNAAEQIIKNENKWMNNLKKGKKVEIGSAIIQCKYNTLSINEKNFNINEIKEIELTSKTIMVSEYKNSFLDTSTSHSYRKELVTKMSLAEYHNKRKSDAEDYYSSRGYPLQTGIINTYDFHNKYYILITFNNGNQESCFIGESIDTFENLPNDYIERKMILDLGNYINYLKFKT